MFKNGTARFHCVCLIISAALLGFVTIIGCSGGGGGGGGDTSDTASSKADLSEAAVSESLADIDDYIPGCTEADTLAPAATAAAEKDGALYPLIQMVSKNWKHRVAAAAVPDFDQEVIAGDCAADPGSMTITREHASGITTYTFAFDGFCTESSTDPLNPNIIEGGITYKQNGTPSDLGPVISSLALSVDDLSITSRGVETVVSIGTLTYAFGTPDVSPPSPTASAPDRITLDRMLVDYASINKTHQLSNLNITTYESNDQAVLAINSARYTTDSKGDIDIATIEPLVLNEDADFVAGTVVLTGANDTVTLSPQTLSTGEATGIIDIMINGEPMDKGLDCSGLSGADDLLLSF